MNRIMLQRMLTQEGAIISLAENGLKAVQVIQDHPHSFDAVMMDIQMPVMDGLTAIQTIRNKLMLNTLPILACSAGVHSQDYFNALASGAAGFVRKPIERESMLEALESVLRITSHPRKTESLDRITADSGKTSWPVIEGIDSQALEQELDGDIEFFITMLTGLQKALKEALAHLPEEIDQAHDKANARLHKLRGSLGCVSATRLIDSCLRLEDSIQADAQGNIHKNWHHLEVELELLMGQVERGLLDSRPSIASASPT